MKTARFCMGILLLTGLAAAIGQAFVPDPEVPAFGTIEGTVMYQGRPVTAGRIFFLEEGHDPSEAIPAVIAADGHYRCPPYWVADRTTRRRYRICVDLLEPEGPTPSSPTNGSAGSGHSGGSLIPSLYPDQGARPADRGERAAMERPGPPDLKRSVLRSPRHRFSDPTTTDLSVWLDDKAARVDIELTD